MRCNSKIISLLGITATWMLTVPQLGTAKALSYPTQWIVENQASVAISLSCEGESMGAGVLKDLRSLRVAGNRRATYTWSEFYYNDGLGLNAAAWFCRDNVSGTNFSRFSTDWGENVTLIIRRSGGQLVLDKR